jgi:hypothetical protein
VTDIKKIAIHYLKGSCLFDLSAIIPFSMIIYGINPNANSKILRIVRLIKMLRIPRLLALLNVERFKQGVNDYYNKRLKIAVKN